MNILITGGSGFLGTSLIPHLKEYDIINFDVQPSSLVETKNGFSNKRVLKKYVEWADIIIHMASKNGVGESEFKPVDTIQRNIILTTMLYEELLHYNNKNIILPSSTQVYGEGKHFCTNCKNFVKNPIRDYEKFNSFECFCPNCHTQLKVFKNNENDLTNPLNIYSISKLYQENIFWKLRSKHKVKILRFPIVYGKEQLKSGSYSGLIGTLVNKAKKNEDITLCEDGGIIKNLVSVDDVIDGILKSLGSESNIFNIGSFKHLSLLEIADTIIKIFNSSSKINKDNTLNYLDSRKNMIDINKSINEIKYSPKCDFSEELKKF